MTHPSRSTRQALALGLFFLAAVGGCASLGNPNSGNPNAPETVFRGISGVKISIPPDRPNACPKQVNVDRLVQNAEKEGLHFTACDVACLNLEPHSGRLFGNCTTTSGGNRGFAGVLKENENGIHVLHEVVLIQNSGAPKLSRR